MGGTRELLRELALAEDLHPDARRVARPFSRSESGVTSAPVVEARLEVAQVHRLSLVRNVSKGIDCFMCGPRSLRIRMWMGIWPPSKLERLFAPEREP